MKTIDIHAHIVPDSLWKAVAASRDWHGFRHEPGEGLGAMVGGGMRTGFTTPKVRYTVEERLKDMDEQKVDVQVLSIHMPFVGYHLGAAEGLGLAREEQKRREWRWENALRRHNFVGLVGEVMKGVTAQKVKEGSYEKWVEEAKASTRKRVEDRQKRGQQGDEMDVS